MNRPAQNIDPEEVAKFDAIASRWWDPESDFKPLHDLNPLRIDYIDRQAQIENKNVLDVGCGGGLLAEAMALRGATVTGIDAGETPISVAKLHQLESGVAVEYRCDTAEEYAEQHAGTFDVVTCLEMLEHVPDPASVVESCARMTKPGGHILFSTLNRNLKSYLLAIVGAEYILGMLPKGTHRYDKFIRPSELDSWARAVKLRLTDISGILYNPLTREYRLGSDVDVNYICCFVKSAL